MSAWVNKALLRQLKPEMHNAIIILGSFDQIKVNIVNSTCPATAPGQLVSRDSQIAVLFSFDRYVDGCQSDAPMSGIPAGTIMSCCVSVVTYFSRAFVLDL